MFAEGEEMYLQGEMTLPFLCCCPQPLEDRRQSGGPRAKSRPPHHFMRPVVRRWRVHAASEHKFTIFQFFKFFILSIFYNKIIICLKSQFYILKRLDFYTKYMHDLQTTEFEILLKKLAKIYFWCCDITMSVILLFLLLRHKMMVLQWKTFN